MKRVLIGVLAAAVVAAVIVGCSGGGDRPQGSAADVDVELDDIMEAIRAAYGEDYLPNGEIPPEVLEAEFGLAPDLYEDVRGEMPMISAQNDRVVVVKAAAGKGDAVETALEDARQRKIDDTLQYPMNIPKTNAARVVRQGDYVAFLLVGANNDGMEDAQGAAEKQFAEDEVQKAVDAFESVFKV